MANNATGPHKGAVTHNQDQLATGLEPDSFKKSNTRKIREHKPTPVVEFELLLVAILICFFD